MEMVQMKETCDERPRVDCHSSGDISQFSVWKCSSYYKKILYTAVGQDSVLSSRAFQILVHYPCSIKEYGKELKLEKF